MSNGASPDWRARVIPTVLFSIGGLLLLAVGLAIRDVFRVAGNDDVADIVSLIRTLIWPATTLFIVSLFQQPISAFLERLSKVTIKAGDAETTLEAAEARAKVSALLGAAASTAPVDVSKATPKAVTTELVTNSAENVARIVNEQTILKFSRGSILWVDDRPENNQYLIRAFQELGIRVDLAISTDAAMKLWSQHGYDVIITDMGRPPDTRAGYTLLKALRNANNEIPVIVYAGSDSDEHRREALEAGAIDSTNSPQNVFNLVTTIISSKPN